MTEINEISTALAKAQAVITNPPRNREVTVKTRGGYDYKFRYATLDSIIEHVRKPLTENGLWFVQTLQDSDGKYRLVTRLVHSSGQSIESETPLLVDGSGNQAFGSALTYMRRYALTSLLGIAADEDDDANHAEGKLITDSKEKGARGAAAAQARADGPKDAPRDSRSPAWQGPLNKTSLSNEIKALHARIGDAPSPDDLDVVLDEYAQVLAQAQHDMPEWLTGDGMPENYVPTNERIRAKREFFNQMETLNAG